jgi:glycosyltransferase involved in cell wall biosynthesis
MSDSILIVAPSAYPLGGVATWLDYLLPGLVNRGWRAVLGLVAGYFHDADRYQAVHRWSDFLKIQNLTGTREARIRALIRAIRHVRPQLVAAVNIPDTYAAIARMRARGEPTPHVAMTDHSLEEEYFRDAEMYASVLDGLICTNRLGCRLAADRGKLDAASIHYAPYGVDVPPRIEAVRRQSGILRIAYSGRLDKFQKRVHLLPDVLANLERRGVEYELSIAGSGPYEDELKARLASQIQAGSVRWLGVLRHEDVIERVYARAHVLLVTSFWETGPIVMLEAMAQGLPVVTSRYVGSGLEGGLKDGENCLLYEVGDAEGAAHQLQRAAHPVLRHSLAVAGHDLVSQRYSREKSITAWDRSFRKVLDAPVRREVITESSPTPAGRLDRLLGIERAESVRQVLGRRYQHIEPGGEWPHSHSSRSMDFAAYWRQVKLLDRVESS